MKYFTVYITDTIIWTMLYSVLTVNHIDVNNIELRTINSNIEEFHMHVIFIFIFDILQIPTW